MTYRKPQLMDIFFYRRLNVTLCSLVAMIVFNCAMSSTAYALRIMNFQIERPSLGLSLSYEFENGRRSGISEDIDNTSHTYKETVDIETRGWIVYPRFITYRLKISPEWEQTEQSESIASPVATRSSLIGYSASISLLPIKPYTLTLLANRQRSTITTTFAERSNLESDLYGAGLNLKYRVLPTQIDYRNLKNVQTGFFESTRESESVSLDMRYDRHLGESILNAEYTDVSTSFEDRTIANEIQSVSFRNYYSFSNNVALTSRASFSETQGGSSVTTVYKVNEALNWQHKTNLRTHYSFNYDKTLFDTVRSETTGIGFDLSTLLTRNLGASLSANGSFNNSTAVEEIFYGTGLSLNYKSAVPFGKIHLATRHNYSVNNRQINSDFSEIRDELVTLTSGPGVQLIRQDIVVDSIVVTDFTGTVVYKKDVHYRLREDGDRVFISRISLVADPIPAIPDGDTVLVDYLYRNTDLFDFSTFNQSYKADLFIGSAWKLYYDFTQATQTVISGTAAEDPSDDTFHNAGIEYQWRWSKTAVDYQNREISNLSSEILRVRETISFNPSRRTFLSISGGYSTVKFTDSDIRDDFYDFDAYFSWIPRSNVSVTVEGFHNRQAGDIVEITDTEISTLLQYTRGIWIGTLEYRFENSKDLRSSDEFINHMVKVEIIRSIY